MSRPDYDEGTRLLFSETTSLVRRQHIKNPGVQRALYHIYQIVIDWLWEEEYSINMRELGGRVHCLSTVCCWNLRQPDHNLRSSTGNLIWLIPTQCNTYLDFKIQTKIWFHWDQKSKPNFYWELFSVSTANAPHLVLPDSAGSVRPRFLCLQPSSDCLSGGGYLEDNYHGESCSSLLKSWCW